ncbi:hypothetical protein CANCADRAFT_1780 [Tortispora caseinolytica NRRL Y-17796]|uniref:Mitochondrial oxaloacetate transport protein n=1 Tax=Tortispora caseinolytica NRRL Y-17796 TaxID=767744 RepID=A0A1E4TE78_9ASCO|nr:hypothetical protein CANCADRAFT_1780 [Tortispora caseinolytica NRRL Y-17796]
MSEAKISTTSIPEPVLAQKKQISTLGGFIGGAIAACGAVTVTNPVEMVKTRMQLQGELSGTNAKKVYTGLFQALRVIYKNEGIRGWQRGLTAAYIYQIGLNGSRLGFYEPIRQGTSSVFYGDQNNRMWTSVFAGATSGIIGAVLGSPFYLIKTRMQSYSPTLPVGQQTYYKSVLHGLISVYKTEGIRGLYRGVDAAIFRTGSGSSVQLPIYNYAKTMLLEHNLVQEGPTLHLLSSTASGFGVCVVMNPGDVLLTRMYNQHGKSLYKNPVDCLVKTVRSEGIAALYKGFFAHLMRIGPHTILTLTLMEQTMKWVARFEGVA